MPVCTVFLLSLSVPIARFLALLPSSEIEPLTVARVVRWIVKPTTISRDILLAENVKWDLLLIIAGTEPMPQKLRDLIAQEWIVYAGIPSRVLKDFASSNERLLRPKPGDVKPLTGALEKPLISQSSQSLELSEELQHWISDFSTQDGKGAVSMLNLLAFKDGMKDEYLKYGQAFASSAGSLRGGNAKLVGKVVEPSSTDIRPEWDEIALAHYPTIQHFADMLASQDYQDINKRHRIPALKDTFILCTSELGVPWLATRANL